MRKTNKKGFTIVELVIVIAVVAILAAVLIPTFVSVTKKANQSADIQACRQMNTYLAVNEVTADKDIVEVYKALEEGGMTAKNYKPLSSNTYYFWDSKLNRVLYTNENYEVTFPEEYKNVKHTDADHQWYSLSAEIKGDSGYTGKGTGKISVNSGAQLYQAVKDLQPSEETILSSKNNITGSFQNSINQTTTITLNGDIDMMGGEFSFGMVSKNVSFTLDGKGHTIRGISNLTNGVDNQKLNGEGKDRNYYSGIIKYVDNVATVTIKNIIFEDMVGGKSDVGSAGLLVGKAMNKDTVITFDGVQIKNSTLYGKNKLGALIGAQGNNGAEVIIKNTKLENVNIISNEGESGILFGSTADGGVNEKIKLDSKLIESADFIKNCSVVCNSDKVFNVMPADGFNATQDGKVVEKIDEANVYRPTTAYYGFAGLGSGKYAFTSTEITATTATSFNPINKVEQAKAAGWVWNFSGETPIQVK